MPAPSPPPAPVSSAWPKAYRRQYARSLTASRSTATRGPGRTVSRTAVHRSVACVDAGGADAGHLIAGRRDVQFVLPAAEEDADIASLVPHDDIAGHRQMTRAAVGPRDADVDMGGAWLLTPVVEDLVPQDRGAVPVLDRPEDAVPGARSLPGREVLDVIAEDCRPEQPARADGVLADVIEVVARDIPSRGVLEVDRVQPRISDLVVVQESVGHGVARVGDLEAVSAAAGDEIVVKAAVHAGVHDRATGRVRVRVHDPRPAAAADVHVLHVDLPVEQDDPVGPAGAVAGDGEVADGERITGRRGVVGICG